MAVYKDKNGTWYVSIRYDNWQGEHARKVKRGFQTKKEAMEKFIAEPISLDCMCEDVFQCFFGKRATSSG